MRSPRADHHLGVTDTDEPSVTHPCRPCLAMMLRVGRQPNAPLTAAGRRRLCERVDAGRPIAHVAAEAGISRRCLAKWYARWKEAGPACYGIAPSIVEQRGYVLVVASASSYTAVPGMAAYGASKAGVE